MKRKQNEIQVSSVADNGDFLWVRDGIHGGVYKYSKDKKKIVFEVKDSTFAINTQERLFLASSDKKLFLVGHRNPECIYIWDKERNTFENKYLNEIKGKIIGVEYMDGELILVPHSLRTPLYVINTQNWKSNVIRIESISDENREAWDYSCNNNYICMTFMGADYVLIIPCVNDHNPKVLRICDCALSGVCVVDNLIYALTSDGRVLVRNLFNDVVDEIKIPSKYCFSQNFVRICGDIKNLYLLPIDGNRILTYEMESRRWETIKGASLLPGFSEDRTIAQYWYWYRWKEESVFLPFRHRMIVEHDSGQDEYKLQLPEEDMDIQLKDNYRYRESMNSGFVSMEDLQYDLSFFLRYLTFE